MYRMRSSAVRLCQRGEALCPRGGAGPPARGQEGSARRAGSCRPETSSWTPRTPVNHSTRPKPFRGGLHISACADTNLNTHYCRTSPWLSPNGNPQVNPALLRGGPGWPGVHVQPLLLRGGPGWPGVHVQPPLLLRGGPGWPGVHVQPLLLRGGPGWPGVHVQPPLLLRGGPGWPGVHVQPPLLLRGGPGWPGVHVQPLLLRGGPGWPGVHVQPLLLRGGPGWPGVHLQPLLLRGGPGWPGVHLQPLLRSSGARGLCSGRSRPPQDTDPSPEQNESQGSSVHVPGHGLFKFKELHENPWTVPNLLCVCRIVLSPYLGYLIIHQHFYLSLALFTLAGATDMLDGYIARTWPNQKSALGSALDPLADKILISVLYVSLTYAQLIPAPLTALVIFRDVGLIAAVFWVRYKTVPPPVTLSKFFNPCYTTAQLKPTLFSKVNTAIQLLLVAASLAAPVFKYTDSPLLQSLWYVTAATTAASGYSYWHYGRKTVRVLNTKSP